MKWTPERWLGTMAFALDVERVTVKLEINEFIYKCYRLAQRKQQKLELNNLVAEHVGFLTNTDDVLYN